jgi:magnesium chelatase subunit I
MHFGLIPRTNRGIFCVNELPDLSPKIQVGLFNVLEERDIQIRGYPIRLELDLCLVFSANPEDYTNRGRIVTPLKDRIGSVIRTHYPRTREEGTAITDANAWVERDGPTVLVPNYMKEIVEEIARLARSSPAVNQNSGVSVRMSIANYENLVSNAERRAILLKESPAAPRISDLLALAASARGKIELTMSEDDGHEDKLILRLIGEAVKNIFEAHFDTKQLREVIEAFEGTETFAVGDQIPSASYVDRLKNVAALRKEVERFIKSAAASRPDSHDALAASAAEFILEGLHVNNRLNKHAKAGGTVYRR